ncbi:hypothetical protein, partial [uncultured Bacteroides sp.]|uniref:hypothetical protein n=1 Tax=uncultured Bacteroides sp. TaxID=162156 RepID=UPI0025E6E7BC
GKGEGRLEQIQSIRLLKREKDELKTGSLFLCLYHRPVAIYYTTLEKGTTETPIYRCLPY